MMMYVYVVPYYPVIIILTFYQSLAKNRAGGEREAKLQVIKYIVICYCDVMCCDENLLIRHISKP